MNIDTLIDDDWDELMACLGVLKTCNCMSPSTKNPYQCFRCGFIHALKVVGIEDSKDLIEDFDAPSC